MISEPIRYPQSPRRTHWLWLGLIAGAITYASLSKNTKLTRCSNPYTCQLPTRPADSNSIGQSLVSDAQCAALTFKLYDAFLASECSSIDDIAKVVGITSRSATAWISLLASGGLLSVHENKFCLTQETFTYFVSSSPYFTKCTHESSMLEAFITGGRTNSGNMRLLANSSHLKEFLGIMTRDTLPDSAYIGKLDLFSRFRTLIDVGAGPAVLSLGIAANNPNIAVTLMDTPPVCNIAYQNAVKAGLADRVSCVEGNMFRMIPANFEAAHFGNIFHDYDDEDCLLLAKMTFSALQSGGWILLHELLFYPWKEGPLAASVLNYYMFTMEEGRQRTLADFDRILGSAGFQNLTTYSLPSAYSLLAARKPPL